MVRDDQTTRARKERWLAQFGTTPVVPPAGCLPGSPSTGQTVLDFEAMATPEGGGPRAELVGPADGCASLFKAHIPTEKVKRPIGGGFRYVPDNANDEFFVTMKGGMVVLSRSDTAPWVDGDGSEKNPRYRRKGGGVKQGIKEFSTRSRRRMSQQLAQVEWQSLLEHGLAAHLVLTYPKDFPSPGKAKDHLEAWRERMRREYGNQLFGFWKIEPQERGAPHFHCLLVLLNDRTIALCDGGEFEELRQIAVDAWIDVVGSDDPSHRVHHYKDRRVCQRVRDWQHVVRYVGKYVGKPTRTEGWDHPGRYWGKINGDCFLIWARGRCFKVGRREWYDLRRSLRKHTIRRSDGSRPPVAAKMRRSLAARGTGTWRHFLPCAGAGGLRSFDSVVRVALVEAEHVSDMQGFL